MPTPSIEKPLRILHLTAGSDAGGLSRYILELGTAMVAAGHSVAVAGERGAWHARFESSPLTWIDVPLKGGPISLRRAKRRLSNWLRHHPVDVLHAHYRRCTLVGRMLQRRHSIPLLYTLHLSDLPLGWRRRFTDFGDHVHTPSVEGARWLMQDAQVPGESVTTLPHGLDMGRFPVALPAAKAAARAALRLPAEATIALFVGRFDDPKNEGWMLDLAASVAALPDAAPNLHVLLVGQGPHEKRLRERLVDENLAARVTILGDQSDPWRVYAAADALLLPSAREGFSLVSAEAMAVGVPVLRTRTAGAEELIVENVTGRAVPIDRSAFVTAAVALLRDKPALRRMGAAAASHVRTGFTFDRQYRETIALYRRLVKGHDAASQAGV